MPEFDANDETTRLPGPDPEVPEDLVGSRRPHAGRGAGLTGGGRRAAARNYGARFAPSLAVRRRAARVSCGRPAPAPLLVVRSRRAPCSRLRPTPPGHLI